MNALGDGVIDKDVLLMTPCNPVVNASVVILVLSFTRIILPMKFECSTGSIAYEYSKLDCAGSFALKA